jgi:hypothetical protein
MPTLVALFPTLVMCVAGIMIRDHETSLQYQMKKYEIEGEIFMWKF